MAFMLNLVAEPAFVKRLASIPACFRTIMQQRASYNIHLFVIMVMGAVHRFILQ